MCRWLPTTRVSLSLVSDDAMDASRQVMQTPTMRSGADAYLPGGEQADDA